MARWTCPNCQRQFGKRNQSHECAPAMTLDDYFSTGPPRERPIFDAVMAHLDTVGDVYVEPVSVGIFLRRTRKFAQLRPMQNWVALSFSLRRKVTHPLIKRKVIEYHGWYHHTANIAEPSDVDDHIRGWLTEAYLDDTPD